VVQAQAAAEQQATENTVAVDNGATEKLASDLAAEQQKSKQLNDDLVGLQSRVAALQATNSANAEKLSKTAQEAQVYANELEVIKLSHAESLRNSDENSAALQSSLVDRDAEIEKLKAQLAERTNSADDGQSKQEFLDLQTEQEELLELLSDQQAKLKEYGSRLRALGEEVSDDDDDSDGSDLDD